MSSSFYWLNPYNWEASPSYLVPILDIFRFEDTELEIQFPVAPGAVMPPQKGCKKAWPRHLYGSQELEILPLG